MAKIVCLMGEVVVGRFQGRVNVFFYSFRLFQVAHVFVDNVAHVHREEFSKDHGLFAVLPYTFHFNSGQFLLTYFKTIAQVVIEDHAEVFSTGLIRERNGEEPECTAGRR